ncbi:unnamed protein product [Toxocara canis]|uniref:Uncharacterized protein n=1 Tax=Toxocara canis TaxID=6265 RepID=A0A183URY9_TOXCA|nr:unnamed protein product [Toxocara canis]
MDMALIFIPIRNGFRWLLNTVACVRHKDVEIDKAALPHTVCAHNEWPSDGDAPHTALLSLSLKYLNTSLTIPE